VRAKVSKVDVPCSKLKVEIARILKSEGYIANFKVNEDTKQNVLRVYLKYGAGMERVITDLQRVSKPGCRIYCGKDQIPGSTEDWDQHPLDLAGTHDRTSAAREGVGGEILCNVW
jgi:small subunit ribosomal protein S8